MWYLDVTDDDEPTDRSALDLTCGVLRGVGSCLVPLTDLIDGPARFEKASDLLLPLPPPADLNDDALASREERGHRAAETNGARLPCLPALIAVRCSLSGLVGGG
jgi:hypothetical protein